MYCIVEQACVNHVHMCCAVGSGGGTVLHISLADLLAAEQRGKWWLVGSAWQGRTLEPSKLGMYSLCFQVAS